MSNTPGNPIADLVASFQELVSNVPDPVQPLVVALAGAVPFIEGEGAAAIGIVGGIHPAVAGVAAAAGNLLAVVLLVLVGSGVRRAIVGAPDPQRSPSKRMQKFQRAFVRFGVPGVSLLGPLLLPTHFTATALVASGVSKATVLVWQAVAIVLWTTVIVVIISTVVSAL